MWLPLSFHSHDSSHYTIWAQQRDIVQVSSISPVHLQDHSQKKHVYTLNRYFVHNTNCYITRHIFLLQAHSVQWQWLPPCTPIHSTNTLLCRSVSSDSANILLNKTVCAEPVSVSQYNHWFVTFIHTHMWHTAFRDKTLKRIAIKPLAAFRNRLGMI